MLVALVPALRAARRQALERVAYPEGPALAARAKLIGEADVTIETLLGEHRAIVDAAAELGHTIPDLPANVARRHREARQRKAVEDFNEVNARAIARGAVRAREYEQL